MDEIRDRAAGLDVHSDMVLACARTPGPRGGRRRVSARFGTMTADLLALADWLTEQGVRTVAMEATGVYWKPVYYALEGLFDEVILVNAGHVKNVPGRKTDQSDAQWLAEVVAHGLARPSFVPPPPVRELRELTRYRKTQVRERARELQRLDKVLQDAGIKISSVASKVWSVSSRRMVEALIAGERDPQALAGLALGRMRGKTPQLQRALVGRFGAHHAVVCQQIIEHIDFLDRSIGTLTEQIEARLDPFAEQRRLLLTIPGIGELVAQTVLAETGGDMSKFPTAKHFAAWAGVVPANHESNGKRRRAGTRHGSRHLREELVEAAHSVARAKDCYLAVRYHRLAGPHGRDSGRAAVATANSLAQLIWTVLTTGQPYRELGADYYTQRRDPERETRTLIRRLEALGHKVTLEPAA